MIDWMMVAEDDGDWMMMDSWMMVDCMMTMMTSNDKSNDDNWLNDGERWWIAWWWIVWWRVMIDWMMMMTEDDGWRWLID